MAIKIIMLVIILVITIISLAIIKNLIQQKSSSDIQTKINNLYLSWICLLWTRVSIKLECLIWRFD